MTPALVASQRRDRRVLQGLAWLVCGLAITAYLGKLLLVIVGGTDAAYPATDLRIYLDAAAHLRSGAPIYQAQVDIQRSGWPYAYPPLLAQLLLPLSNYTTAWWVWTVLSVACWLGSLGVLLWEQRTRVWCALRPEWRPVLLAGALLWPSVMLDIFVGQVELPLLALLCASWWALGAGHRRTAGLLLGGAIALKPLPAAAMVSLVAARHWRVAGAAAVTAGVLALVSFGLVGWDQTARFAFQVGPGLGRVYATNPSNGSVAMSLGRVAGLDHTPDWLALLVGLTVTGGVALAAWRWRPEGRRALALGVTACLLSSPVLESHYLLLAYLPMGQAFADAAGRPGLRLTVAVLDAVLIGSAFVLGGPSDPPLVLAIKSSLPSAVLLGVLVVQCRELGAAARLRPGRNI